MVAHKLEYGEARAHGLRHDVAMQRMRRGWTREEALGLSPAPRNISELYHMRGEYKTLADWSRELGISAKILSARILCGMTSEQALSMPAQAPTTVDHTGLYRWDLADNAKLGDVGDELGVTRQRVEQLQLLGMGKVQRALIAAKCIEWRSEFGEVLTDDEIADIIVAVADDAGIKQRLFASDFDVADLCDAMLMLRREAAP